VTPKGPNPPGGGPDNEGAGDHEQREGQDESAHSDAQKGWLPPEDRLWLHPSELPSGVHAPRTGAPVSQVPTKPRARRPRDFTTTIGVMGAVAAVAVGVFFLVETGMTSSPTAPLDSTVASFTLSEGCCTPVPAAARAADDAMVALSIKASHDTTQGCGVAVMGGGLIATLADAVRGATSIMATASDGEQEPATVVAVDHHSDIALLRVSSDLPTARFANDMTERPDATVVVMAMAPQRHSKKPATAWAKTTVRSVGEAVTTGDASGMAGLDAATVKVPAVPGEILVAPNGAVVGLLDATADAGAPGAEVFLPSDVVVGVSVQLAATGQVRHGWLDIAGHDASATGALVASVEPHGASVHALRPGDVIVGVDGDPVRSMAELRSRLYVLAPGTSVQLNVTHGGSTGSVDVTLSSSP